jgi:uncharacterized protein involved in exopolysaccharide biosynthesis
MNQNEIKFDLIDAIKVGLKWKKYILGFALLTSVIVALYAYNLKNIFKSYTLFYPSSALIGSRDNLFRTEVQDGVDQIGLENEVDRVVVIANSAPIVSDLIEEFKMTEHYGIDPKDPKAKQKTYKRFAKNYKVAKGASGQIELTFTDWDAQLGSDILNKAIPAIQDKYRFIYTNSGHGIAEALTMQTLHIDSMINTLTDSLVTLRDQYGIYDIISPGRKGSVSTSSRNARGIEVIQNVEELKDQFVRDRAKFESLKNEHVTVTHKSIPFLQVIQYPSPGGEKVSPFRTMMVLGTFAASIFIGLVIALLAEFFVSIKHKF